MVKSIHSPEYHVDTFLDMEKGLANYLNEAYDNDSGTWTREQKQRFLNLACINIVARLLINKTTLTKSIEATAEEVTDFFDTPGDLLKVHRLWIDGNEFAEVNENDWFKNLVTLRRSSSFHGKRIFWHDDDTNQIYFAPAMNTRVDYVMRYVRIPKKMDKDGSIPDLHPLLWHVPPMWAAWRMTYRDEEHGDRGRSARADYKDAITEFNRFKYNESGNKQHKITLDPLMFPGKNNLTASVDLGDTFDITD